MQTQLKFFLFIIGLLFSLNIRGQAINLAVDLTEGEEGTFFDESNYDNGIIGTIDNSIYMYAYNFDQSTYRIWSYDSENKTSRVLFQNSTVEDIRNFLIHDKRLYFVAEFETLYVIENNTPAKIVFESDDYIKSLLVFRNEVHFINDDLLMKISNSGEVKELYKFGFFGASAMKELDNNLIIIGRDSNNDELLFKSDGTTAGTLPYFPLNTGSSFRSDFNMTVVDNKLYFWYSLETNFVDLFVTDGTVIGTKNLKRFVAIDFADFTGDKSIISYKNKIYFRAETESDGDNMYVSDGTVGGTKLFYNPNSDGADSRPKDMVVYKNKLYFSAVNSFWNPSLYVTDGSTPTKVFADFKYSGLYLAEFNDSLYFQGAKDDWNGELFSSNGTSSGTKQISRESGEFSFSPYSLTSVNGLLFFIAEKEETGYELYYYDPKFSSSINFTSLVDIQVFPNPAKETIKLLIDDSMINGINGIEIHDIRGIVVLKVDTNLESIDIRNLAKGVYTLSIMIENNKYSKLFIKD